MVVTGAAVVTLASRISGTSASVVDEDVATSNPGVVGLVGRLSQTTSAESEQTMRASLNRVPGGQ